MSRYFINSDASPPGDFDFTSPPPYRSDRDVTVYDGFELKPQDTGVLNKYGQKIFRAGNEIGFNR